MGARGYVAELGQWTSVDPLAVDAPEQVTNRNPGDENAYAYAAGRPTTLIDPNGHIAVGALVLGASIVIGVVATCQYANAPGPHDPLYHKNVGQMMVDGAENVALVYDTIQTGRGILRCPKELAGPKGKSGEAISKGPTSPNVRANPGGSPATQSRTRLPQDVSANPKPPRALPLNRPIGQSPSQNKVLQQDIAAARKAGGRDFRVNQQQVNAQGQRVGTNRPDLQYTDKNGVRQYVEYDTPSSGRGPGHRDRLFANDPKGNVTLKVVP